MLKWIRSDKEPVLSSIEISSEWKELNLESDDNYAIWIGHSTYLLKKMELQFLQTQFFQKEPLHLRILVRRD